MRWKALCAAATAAIVVFAFGQSRPGGAPAENPTFAQLASAVRVTLRDSAELPMKMNVTTVATDSSGRVRKQKTGSYEFDFHGFNPRSGQSGYDFRGSRGTIRAAVSTMQFTVAPSMINAQDAEKTFSLQIDRGTEPAAPVAVKLKTVNACEPFQWSAENQLPKSYCGDIDFEFSRDDLTMRSFVFRSGGLPASAKVESLDSVTVLGYRMAATFQKAGLRGDPQPFLIPVRVTVTIETDKGRIETTSLFALRKQGHS
jgi:hypothetical protein